MAWPSPAVILYVLGAFVVGYGLSLAVRASRARRWKSARESCPDCAAAWPAADAPACARCGARPPAASAIRWAGGWMLGGAMVSTAGVGVFMLGLVVAEEMRGQFGGRGGVSIGPFLGGGMGLALFGVYVAIVGYRGQASRGRRRCPKCWYLIDAALGRKCSECGHEARRERDLYRPRRRWRLAALGLLLVLIGQLGWVESRVQRGGWLAAVPTEVLIIGMAWAPHGWLVNGMPGADEDASLSGRLRRRGNRDADAPVWTWHRPWAESRAAALLRHAESTDEASRWLSCLRHLEYGEVAVEHPEALVHAARLAVAGLGDPMDTQAGPVLMNVFEAGWLPRAGPDAPLTPADGLSRLIGDSRATLLATIADPANPHSLGAAAFLGMGEGEPEVVAALIGAMPSNRMARVGLITLAREHEHVRPAILAALDDPDPQRRQSAIRGAAMLMRVDRDGPAAGAVAALLDDPDPAIVLTAAESLWWESREPEVRLRAFDSMVAAARADPALLNRAATSVGHAFMGLEIDQLQPRLMAMAQRGGADQRLFLAIVIENSHSLSPIVSARAAELLDAGVPVPPGATPEQIERVRARRPDLPHPDPP